MNAEPTRSRGRAILRAAFLTLRRNPRLMWFPVLSILGGMAVVTFAMALQALVGRVAADPTVALGPFDLLADGYFDPGSTERRGAVLSGVVVGFGLHFVSLLCAVGLSRATFDALAGRPWSIRGSLGHAGGRLGAIASFAVVSVGVGRVLRGQKQRPRHGRLARTLAREAWWAVTYLVVPVLARERRGGLASIARSASLLRDTWKETFVGRLVLGWLWLVFILAMVASVALCTWLGVRDPRVLGLAIGFPVVTFVVVGLGMRTLDTIYRTALYVFATEGVVPEPFDDPDLHEIFCVR